MAGLRKEDYVARAAFRRALRRFLHLSEEAARAVGLTPQQHQVLLAIKGQPDRDWASVGELADALQTKHHAMVGLIDRGQAAGLFYRSPDPEDRRVVRVSLTEKGEEILERITEQSAEELRVLRALMLALESSTP